MVAVDIDLPWFQSDVVHELAVPGVFIPDELVEPLGRLVDNDQPRLAGEILEGEMQVAAFAVGAGRESSRVCLGPRRSFPKPS